MQSYLMKDLGVPEDHICILTDSAATRKGLLDALYRHLLENPRIKRGDAIIFHFSGHGSSYEASEVWPGAIGSIEALCPVDRSVGCQIADISDREIFSIMSDLRAAKGDNITLILDCCHSAGIPRDLASHRNKIRAAAPLPGLLGCMLEAAAKNRSRSHYSIFHSDFWKPDMTTFVVLAACQDFELAWETSTYTGQFTSALIMGLKSLPLSTTTYGELIRHIGPLPNPDAPRQHPVAFGSRVNNLLFNLPPVNYTSRV